MRPAPERHLNARGVELRPSRIWCTTSAEMRILLVDDHVEVLELVARALERDDHRVTTAGSLQAARAALSAEPADLLILDLGLPDGSGEAFCRELRGGGFEAPILVLTARSAVAERVACLDGGADDFLSKPFAVAELRARVRALGRRRSVPRVVVYERPGLRLHFSERTAWVNGVQAPITSREWSILELLAARRGRVVSRQELLEGVWGDVDESTSGSLEVLIARIRKKLASDLIRTVRGEGYAFEA